MKKSKADSIVKLWNEEYADITKETRTKAVSHKSALKGDYDVEILPVAPENTGDTFYPVLELGLVVSTFRVSSFINSDDEGKLIAVLF